MIQTIEEPALRRGRNQPRAPHRGGGGAIRGLDSCVARADARGFCRA